MYQIEITRRAGKELGKLDAGVRRRIHHVIEALAEQPRPPGCLKFTGTERTWQIRVGDYRVLYQMIDWSSF